MASDEQSNKRRFDMNESKEDAVKRPRTSDSSSVSTLSDTQQSVVNKVKRGENVFFTGAAGTGKTHVLRHLIDHVIGTGSMFDCVYKTASTGIVALPLGGSTLHSFAGVGLAQDPVPDLLKKMSKKARDRWRECTVLIVEEVSMIEADLLDKLDAIAKAVRHNELPFGGIQVILTGDFLQLPPVGRGARFIFDAKCWNDLVPPENRIVLQTIFRQSQPIFITMLNNLRVGQVTAECEVIIKQCIDRKLEAKNGVEATVLYCTRNDVENENVVRLKALAGGSRMYAARDWGEQNFLEQLRKNTLAPAALELRVGAQVMLLKNLDVEGGLVNGSRGVVTGFRQEFSDPDEKPVRSGGFFPVVLFENGITRLITPEEFKIEERGQIKAARKQVPLMLAWAITVHKCQGMTLDSVIVDLRQAFEFGQVYVALSRARSIEGLSIKGFNKAAVKARPDALDFYNSLV